MELKPGYRLTNIGVIPEEWDVSTVGSEFSVQLGKMLDSERNFGIAKPYLGNKAVQWNQINVDSLPTVPMSSADIDRYRLKVGDLLVCEGGDVGRSAIWEGDLGECYYQKALHRLRPLKAFSSKLMVAILQRWSETGRLGNYVTQTSIAHLPRDKFMQVPIPCPSIPEQQAIAESLSDADRLLVSLDRLIAKKRDLKQAAMQQLLTGQARLPGFDGKWGVMRLEDVAHIDPENLDAQTPAQFSFNYISLEDVECGSLRNYSEQSFVNAPSRARRRLRDRDILVSTVRPNLQSHLLFCLDAGDWVCSTGFSVVRCRHRVADAAYVFSLLFTDCVSRQIDALLTGSSYPAINSGDVRALRVPMPPYEEQVAISRILSDMDAELSALEARRDKMRALKQAMTQELLTGNTRLVIAPAEAQPATSTAEPKSEPVTRPRSAKHNWEINEAVVLSVFVSRFATEQSPISRLHRTKLAYLLHRHVEGDVEGYLKKAAGPYNPAVRYKGPERIAIKNGYVRAVDQYGRFVPGERIAKAEQYFEKWYSGDVPSWLDQFRDYKDDHLELLTTVDAAMQELEREAKPITLTAVKTVISVTPEWAPKLKRAIFSDKHIVRAIVKASELFPRG